MHLNASEIFKAEVSQILEGLDGCANAQDDILVWDVTLMICG